MVTLRRKYMTPSSLVSYLELWLHKVLDTPAVGAAAIEGPAAIVLFTNDSYRCYCITPG